MYCCFSKIHRLKRNRLEPEIANSVWLAESQFCTEVIMKQKEITDQLSDHGYPAGCLLVFESHRARQFMKHLKLSHMRLLILPINIGNYHWTLLTVVLPQNLCETIKDYLKNNVEHQPDTIAQQEEESVLQQPMQLEELEVKERSSGDNLRRITDHERPHDHNEGLITYFDSLPGYPERRQEELAAAVRRCAS